MPRKAFIFLIAAFISGGMAFSVNGQDTIRYKAPKQKYRLLDRLDFGGYLGAQFGTITMIDVSPIVSYRVTDQFYTGIGFNYQFYKYEYSPGYSYKSNAYGGTLFARYFIWRDLFAHVEYDPLFVNYYDYFDNGSGGYNLVKNSVWVQDFLIGGGYRQWVGNRAFVTLMILWNVNETMYSPYRNPIIKIGFGVGF